MKDTSVDDTNMRATRERKPIVYPSPELLAVSYKPTNFWSCGMLWYLPPSQDSTDYRQFATEDVSLLIKNYMSGKVQA